MKHYSYTLTFIEGILTFISPCILPLIPVYFFYLAGLSGDEDRLDRPVKNRLIINSLGFVAGFTLVFVLLGAAATSLGQFFKGNLGIFRKVSAIVVIIFGLSFLTGYRPGFLSREKRFNFKFNKLHFLNSIVFGAVFGFGWTPCVGPFLYTALSIAGSQKTVWQGVLLLFIYSLGLGLPFIITALAFEKLKDALRQIQKYNRIISIISGSVLVLAGIMMW